MHSIIGGIEYVSGHLRSAHYILHLDDKKFKIFEKLSKEEQEEMLEFEGEIVIDDYYLSDRGDITYIDY